MKKIICLLFSLMLLTGCDVVYNLDIDKDYFNEEINFIVPNKASWEKSIEHAKKTKQPAYINEDTDEKYYYDVKLTNDKSNYNLAYNFQYSEKNLLFSNAISTCYKYVNMDTSNNYIDFSTSPLFTCLYRDGSQVIDTVTVNITTPFEVVSNNADKVKGKTYTWKIDNENYQDKPIKIKIKKSNTMAKETYIYIFIVLAIVIIGGILRYLILRKRRNQV